jgi:hypothetical protein
MSGLPGCKATAIPNSNFSEPETLDLSFKSSSTKGTCSAETTQTRSEFGIAATTLIKSSGITQPILRQFSAKIDRLSTSYPDCFRSNNDPVRFAGLQHRQSMPPLLPRPWANDGK